MDGMRTAVGLKEYYPIIWVSAAVSGDRLESCPGQCLLSLMMFIFLQSPTQVQRGGVDNGPAKQPKLVWSEELHQHFLNAVNSLGGINRAGKALEACKVLLGCGTLYVNSVILSSFLYFLSFHAVVAETTPFLDQMQVQGWTRLIVQSHLNVRLTESMSSVPSIRKYT